MLKKPAGGVLRMEDAILQREAAILQMDVAILQKDSVILQTEARILQMDPGVRQDDVYFGTSLMSRATLPYFSYSLFIRAPKCSGDSVQTSSPSASSFARSTSIIN